MAVVLFSEAQLSDICRQRISGLSERLPGLTAEQLQDPKLAVSSIVGEVRIHPPRLERSQGRVKIEPGQPGQWAVEAVIPFTGERNLFFARPSEFSLNPPWGLVTDQNLVLESRLPESSSASDCKASASQAVDRVEQWLQWQQRDADLHNAGLTEVVDRLVHERRDLLMRQQDMQSDLDGDGGV